MQLRATGTAFLAFRPNRPPVVVAVKDPRRALACLIAQGFRPDVAREVAYGELSSEAATRLGRVCGLLADTEPSPLVPIGSLDQIAKIQVLARHCAD